MTPTRDNTIPWEEARSFLRERILAARINDLDGDTLDDLTQEALVRLCQALRRGEASNLSGLMYEIARRTCIDHLRRRRRWNQVIRPLLDDDPEPIAPPSTDGSSLGDPLERLRFMVLEFFRLNHAPCYDIAVDFFESRDWQSVALRAGSSYTAVTKRWSRCVQRLRQAARTNPVWLAEWLASE